MFTQMPRYKCHKEVRALKIKEVLSEPRIYLVFEGEFDSKEVTAEWFRKHKPESGGYFVVYSDGYESYSPAKAFEEGYAVINQRGGIMLTEEQKAEMLDTLTASIRVPVAGVGDWIKAFGLFKQISDLLQQLGLTKGEIWDKAIKIIEAIQANLPEILTIINAVLALFGKSPIDAPTLATLIGS
jgi:hypothetical protein